MNQVYRMFDKDGVLLYIGCSLQTINRLASHKSTKHWFNEIHTIKIEHYNSRFDALKVEAKAIKDELPVHNVNGIKELILEERRKKQYEYLLTYFGKKWQRISRNQYNTYYFVLKMMIIDGVIEGKYSFSLGETRYRLTGKAKH